MSTTATPGTGPAASPPAFPGAREHPLYPPADHLTWARAAR